MSKRFLILLLGCLCCANAAAQSKAETWRCKAGDYFIDREPVLVVAMHGDSDSGTIEVAGTTQETSFWIEGFDRRWDFGPRLGPDNLNRRFSFVIHPDGSAIYVDFTTADENGRAQASQKYACRKD